MFPGSGRWLSEYESAFVLPEADSCTCDNSVQLIFSRIDRNEATTLRRIFLRTVRETY